MLYDCVFYINKLNQASALRIKEMIKSKCVCELMCVYVCLFVLVVLCEYKYDSVYV